MAARRQECSICMDSFKNPKLISCHHSFCYKCLEDYVRVNLHNGRFNCPICRTSVELPICGVSGFQENFYIVTDSSEKFTCDICGPERAACRRCLDCEENLCKSCCYVHEKSKGTRHHKISDLGTLDPEMKGKIRQRIFCDKHTDEEIKLVCRDCNELICVLCKAVSHEIHATETVADAAAEMKKALKTKLNECSDKLRHINVSKQKGEEFDRSIDDAERKEIKAAEDHRSRFNKILNQEFAKARDKIQKTYHNLRQQNAVFKKDVEDAFKTCSDANDNAQTLADQGTDIEIIKKGLALEQLISAVVSKTDQTPNTRLETNLFSPGEIKLSELISMVGITRDSTELSPEEREKKEREHDLNAPITQEHMNHARLCVALVTIGGSALRDILLTNFPVQYKDIYQAILVNRAKLTERQGSTPLLNQDQIQLVFPDLQGQKTGRVNTFDISLLYTLIRHVSTVPAPITGWGFDPQDQPRNTSLGASVERIRSYRNHISGCYHGGKISQQDFMDYWNKFDAVLHDIDAVIGRQVYSPELEKQKRQVISVYEVS